MGPIKFGTDGWRAIIALDYTVENVKRVSKATAMWINGLDLEKSKSVVLGHDCRFGGPMFAEMAARVCAENGVKVFLHSGICSTPMVSLGAERLGASAGIIITASHNPPSYNGFKVKGHYGGPALPAMITEVENLLPENDIADPKSLQEFKDAGLIEDVNLEDLYVEHVEKSFDLEAIRSNLNLAYDAMYGAGQRVFKRLFPNALSIHADYNPGFMGTPPEPIMKNLGEFSQVIKEKGNIDSGLATDGDADRIGLLDGKGEFVDSHHIILMLINYLHQFKGYSGTVATSFSCTTKIAKLCKHYGLDHIVTKIGFKYIAKYMLEKDILVGGEESGGIAVKGHIPERDGIWMALVIWEYMAKTGKSLDALKKDVYEIVGPFAFDRYDLHITDEVKQKVIKTCSDSPYESFGSFTVDRIETVDGFKFILDDEKWIMIRPSGTEPVLRCYAEAPTHAEVIELLEACKATIL